MWVISWSQTTGCYWICTKFRWQVTCDPPHRLQAPCKGSEEGHKNESFMMCLCQILSCFPYPGLSNLILQKIEILSTSSYPGFLTKGFLGPWIDCQSPMDLNAQLLRLSLCLTKHSSMMNKNSSLALIAVFAASVCRFVSLASSWGKRGYRVCLCVQSGK